MQLETLLRLLADGELHSGEALAHACGVSRAAIAKQVRSLERCGLDVAVLRGRGYRLPAPLDLIDRSSLEQRLRLPCALALLEVFTELDSTNRRLLDLPPPAGELAVCLAEHQSAGRGRRGRSWKTPLGGGLCLSVGWMFDETPADVAALTLAVGVVARRVLRAEAGVTVALKWPNDLIWQDRKLGGILVELVIERRGRCHVVVGIGVNVSMADGVLASVSGSPGGAVDLRTAMAAPPPRRELLAARLIEALAGLLTAYPAHGFAPYRDEWSAGDHLLGRTVRIDSAHGGVTGTAIGIEADGALLIELAGGVRRRVLSGEASVRRAP